jgi:hypothetical protein
MSNIFPLDEASELDYELSEDTSADLSDLSIKKVRDLPDGSSVFVVEEDAGEEPRFSPADNDFYENLAHGLDDSLLSGLAAELLEDIEEDRGSRKEWENSVKVALRYLGTKIEEFREVPFERACAAFDSTLSTSLMNFFALARAELFPASGPVKCKVNGIPVKKTEDQAERVELFMNHFLTDVDHDYYPDSDKLLIYIGLFGSAFRKIVMDPIANRPSSRLVKPQNLIINNHATSLLSSSRITHEMFETRKDVMLKQEKGIYVKSSLPEMADESEAVEESVLDTTIREIEGVTDKEGENKTLFKFYEVHVDIDSDRLKDSFGSKDGEKIPRPYIITICAATNKICDIRRNWKENDEMYKRIECFVHYYYLPGFGLYSMGLAQLLGSNAVALTDILRQQLDAGTLKNFPGGLRMRGLRIEDNDKAIGPSEFKEIDTGGLPIQQAVMLMPYDEPSQVLAALRGELKQESLMLGSASQQGAPEFGTNTPVGTILSQIEVQNRIPSTILRSLHASLSYEFKLLYKLFGEYFAEDAYPFNVPGKEVKVLKDDFNNRLQVSPVSDPNVLTTTQRIIKAESLLKLAGSNPELHNMRAVYKRVYEAMNVQDINEILLPEEKEKEKPEEIPALDPITENTHALLGQPVEAAIWQDHQAHIMVHQAFAQQMAQQNPEVGAVLQAHIQQHMAMLYLVQMQMQMGMEMPDETQLENHDIQNAVAIKAAQAVQMQAQQQQAQNPPPLDPNAVMLADIEQKREAAYLKDEESKRRMETDAFKAQLKFEGDKAKIESQERLAQEKAQLEMAKETQKNEKDLAVAQMKHSEKLS